MVDNTFTADYVLSGDNSSLKVTEEKYDHAANSYARVVRAGRSLPHPRKQEWA